jgi:hypothetical protein
MRFMTLLCWMEPLHFKAPKVGGIFPRGPGE